ncbi:hypothetical protein PsorP6_011712 [Peronosclerospora sorghi]|uniref:Uncharacterized protein n=1 Tax=Peronosclerospora sorghi TaxID=230839 RepID=A0ACC0WLL7_9STRA|nr:hypothetical protein PsorP6_011712 [Peronosclerospora sorghi]
MKNDACQHSHTQFSAPPLSRHGKIRTLEIPAGIITQFIMLDAPNTNRPPYGIETCGIFAGILPYLTDIFHSTRSQYDPKLITTTLIIPKQEGSSDMCTMTNEEDLYDFCFSNELLTLDWIHNFTFSALICSKTNPKQNCFLSSVDLHTQCGFQSILPEAVSIVVAPNDPQKTPAAKINVDNGHIPTKIAESF